MRNITLFSQITRLIPKEMFNALVRKYQADYSVKGINSWTHLIAMLFAQFGNCQSLRDISNGLRSATGNLNHLGVHRAPSRSTISYINAHRNWKLFRDLYFKLLEHFNVKVNRIRLKRKIFIVDSTIISLCISLFDWALYRQTKGAIKIHTILDYEMGLPVFADLTEGKVSDIGIARNYVFPRGSVVLADRAYLDFLWLNNLDSSKVFFVIRLKNNILYRVMKSYDLEKEAEYVLFDEDIKLLGQQTSVKYKKQLRLVSVKDPDTGNTYAFVTNNFIWKAETVGMLYKQRWDIETFFKTIKQNLRIKSFIGTSKNAVLIQVWTALITILLLTVLKSRAKYKWHMSNMVVFIRLNLYTKIDLFQWLDNPFWSTGKSPPFDAQLMLF